MNKLNLVTGANGHLGNNVVRALLARGEKVRACVRDLGNKKPFEGLDCEVIYADLMDKDSLWKAMEGVDILYQVAAVFRHWAKDPQKEIITPNLDGTRNVLEAAAARSVKKVVYVSSTQALDHERLPIDESRWNSHFYGNPYVQSKTESEQLAFQLAKELNIQLVSVLPSGMIGPHCFRLTPTMSLLKRAINGEVFADINFHFNLVDVRDVAEGILAATEKGRSGERYMLASELPVSIRRMLELAQRRNPRVRIPPRLPKSLLRIIASTMELVGKTTGREPMLLRNQVELYYGVEQRANIAKARAELGFNPRPPEQAVDEAFACL